MVATNTLMMTSLSKGEREELAEREKQIEWRRNAFQEALEHLAIINEKRLYREDHKTFELYLIKRWSMKRSFAYELIKSVQVTRNLSGIADKVSPSQAREIGHLTPELQKIVWVAASEATDSPQPTAKALGGTLETIVAKGFHSLSAADQKALINKSEKKVAAESTARRTSEQSAERIEKGSGAIAKGLKSFKACNDADKLKLAKAIPADQWDALEELAGIVAVLKSPSRLREPSMN